MTFFSKNPTANEIMFKKYCRVRQATDDSMAHVHCMLIAKDKNTHSEYVILLLFHCQSGHAKAPQCYVIVHFTLNLVWNLFDVCMNAHH